MGDVQLKNGSLAQTVNIYPWDFFLLVHFEQNSPRVSLAQGFLLLQSSPALPLYCVRYQ